ncbi:PA2169 family four-helix-bundle protein [Costertonia aggregata]|uniref:PA2169 family four-helix-bundle protein n=1 Tax=Costertonia aggregata TaxID=343403 RepID=A0A7H9ASV6_9FLAO|nr:PA2169 family four-helix-bundle protein [Costertonia aggregata]QLG46553.1 PA2169 family four-helix-bundle protein [Costertonia aggregata]
MDAKKTELNRLDDILEKIIDAAKTFEKAAELSKNKYLKDYFTKRSKERKKFAESLNFEFKNQYNYTRKIGSAFGVLNRMWLDIKDFFSTDTDEALLEKALQIERQSLEDYKNTLNNDSFPMAIGALLRDQKMRIQVNLNKVKSLADLE